MMVEDGYFLFLRRRGWLLFLLEKTRIVTIFSQEDQDSDLEPRLRPFGLPQPAELVPQHFQAPWFWFFGVQGLELMG